MKLIFTYPNDEDSHYIDPDYVGDDTVGFQKRVKDLKDGNYKVWQGATPGGTVDEIMEGLSKYNNMASLEESNGHNTFYKFWLNPLLEIKTDIVSNDIDDADVVYAPGAITFDFSSLPYGHQFRDGEYIICSNFDSSLAAINGNKYYVKRLNAYELQLAFDEEQTLLVSYDQIRSANITSATAAQPMILTSNNHPFLDQDRVKLKNFDGTVSDLNDKFMYMRVEDANTFKLSYSATSSDFFGLQARQNNLDVLNVTAQNDGNVIIRLADDEPNQEKGASLHLPTYTFDDLTYEIEAHDRTGFVNYPRPAYLLGLEGHGDHLATVGWKTTHLNNDYYNDWSKQWSWGHNKQEYVPRTPAQNIGVREIPDTNQGHMSNDGNVIVRGQQTYFATDSRNTTDAPIVFYYTNGEWNQDTLTGSYSYQTSLHSDYDGKTIAMGCPYTYLYPGSGLDPDGKVMINQRVRPSQVGSYSMRPYIWTVHQTIEGPGSNPTRFGSHVQMSDDSLTLVVGEGIPTVDGHCDYHLYTRTGSGLSKYNNFFTHQQTITGPTTTGNQMFEVNPYRTSGVYDQLEAKFNVWGQLSSDGLCLALVDGSDLIVYRRADQSSLFGTGDVVSTLDTGETDNYITNMQINYDGSVISVIHVKPGGANPDLPPGAQPYYDQDEYFVRVFEYVNSTWSMSDNEQFDTDPWIKSKSASYPTVMVPDYGPPTPASLYGIRDHPFQLRMAKYSGTRLTDQTIIYQRQFSDPQLPLPEGKPGFSSEVRSMKASDARRVLTMLKDTDSTQYVWRPEDGYYHPYAGRDLEDRVNLSQDDVDNLRMTATSTVYFTDHQTVEVDMGEDTLTDSTTGEVITEFGASTPYLIRDPNPVVVTNGTITMDSSVDNKYHATGIENLLLGNQTYKQRTSETTYVNGATWGDTICLAGQEEQDTPDDMPPDIIPQDSNGRLQTISIVGDGGRFDFSDDFAVTIKTRPDSYEPPELTPAQEQDVWNTNDAWTDTSFVGGSGKKEWPTHVTPSRAEIVLNTPTIVNKSQNGIKYARKSGFTKWSLEVEYPAMTKEEFQIFHATAQAAQGQAIPFLFKLENKDGVNILWKDWSKNTDGTNRPRFKDVMDVADTTLLAEGFASNASDAFVEGEVISLIGGNDNGDLHTVISDADANVYGEAKIRISYPVKESNSAGNQIFKEPGSCVVTLNSDDFTYSVDHLGYYYVSVAFELDNYK